MKKWISVLLIGCILTLTIMTDMVSGNDEQVYHFYNIDSTVIGNDKDLHCVMIWVDDIEHASIEEECERILGYSWDNVIQDERKMHSKALERLTLSTSNGCTAYGFFDDEWFVENDELHKKIDDYVAVQRLLSKERYLSSNTMFVEKTGIENAVLYVSAYSPVIIAELSKADMDVVRNTKGINQISEIGISECICDDNEHLEIEQPNNRSVTDYLDYINATGPKSAGLNGSGVKIGLIDASVVTASGHSELSGSSIIPVGTYSSTNGSHSVAMARIICGSSGVAPGCTLYSAELSGPNTELSFYINVELLIDQGVNIINCSYGWNRNENYYTNMEKWVDHIAISHSVSFVKSAGNGDPDGDSITSPGLSYNAITVGNAKYDTDEMNNFSLKKYGSGCRKPDVAAPGDGVLSSSGTSAAAAVTSGTIALLLQAKPSIKNSAAAVKAVLMAGCDRYVGGGIFISGHKDGQGAGLINCSSSLGILSLNHFTYNYVSANGLLTYNAPVASTLTLHSVVFTGMKMNSVPFGSSPGTVTNYTMATTAFYLANGTGGSLTSDTGGISSVRTLRYPLSGTYLTLKLNVTNLPVSGMVYAYAWR